MNSKNVNHQVENDSSEGEGEELWNEIVSNELQLLEEFSRSDRKNLWNKIADYGSRTGKNVPKQILRTNYEDNYDERSLSRKISSYARVAGQKVIFQVFVLYYCLLDRDTPKWAKAPIISALGYFIFPLDAIPDIIVGAGYSDDLGVLVVAMGMVLAHVKDEHKDRAREQVARIFGND